MKIPPSFAGRKHSEESKQKNREKHLGRVTSPQTKLKMSLAHKANKDNSGHFKKGHAPWHKGTVGAYSEEYRKKLSDAKKGKPNWRKGQVGVYKQTEEWKKMMSDKFMGRPLSEETKKKIGEKNRGENNWNWKGGVWDKNFSRSHSFQYKKFRCAVLERDIVCVQCSSGVRLEVHHIKPYALFPDLRLDINNASVLCHSCHKKTDTYGRKEPKYAETK